MACIQTVRTDTDGKIIDPKERTQSLNAPSGPPNPYKEEEVKKEIEGLKLTLS